jgi:hypothetical protein
MSKGRTVKGAILSILGSRSNYANGRTLLLRIIIYLVGSRSNPILEIITLVAAPQA